MKISHQNICQTTSCSTSNSQDATLRPSSCLNHLMQLLHARMIRRSRWSIASLISDCHCFGTPKHWPLNRAFCSLSSISNLVSCELTSAYIFNMSICVYMYMKYGVAPTINNFWM